jgi:hypothetical protein
MNKLIAILTIALVSQLAQAGGPTTPFTSLAKTNNVSFTHTGTSPVYIEAAHIRCGGVNTATVTVVNYPSVTNTLVSAQSTNGIVEYLPTFPVLRVEKGGTVNVTFTSAITTNSVVIPIQQ